MNGYLRSFLGGLLLLTGQLVFGQKETLNQFWNEYAVTHNLSEHWVAELDGGLTTSGVPDKNTVFMDLPSSAYVRGYIIIQPTAGSFLSFMPIITIRMFLN